MLRALFIIICISTLLVDGAVGQDYVFRVLANKGRNQIKKAGSAQSISLKTGSKLMSGDQIIAENGAYIGLVHHSGKTMELRTAGVHSIEDLEKGLNVGSAGVADRYMNFVLGKMRQEDGDVNRNYRQNLNATGAVDRATGSASIKMLVKESKNPNLVLGDKASVKWVPNDEISSYLVTVKNIFGQDLFIIETQRTRLDLDFNHERLANERFILVNVRSKDDENLKSLDYPIKRLTPAEGKQLTDQLAALRSQVGETSSLNKLVYASFYEANGFYLEALSKYEEAIELSPEIDDFKTIYEDFVISNGLGN